MRQNSPTRSSRAGICTCISSRPVRPVPGSDIQCVLNPPDHPTAPTGGTNRTDLTILHAHYASLITDHLAVEEIERILALQPVPVGH